MAEGWRRFCRDRLAIAGLALLLAAVALTAAAPWTGIHDPLAVRMDRRLEPPGRDFWLGTDQFGRDVFSRLIFGARASLGAAGGVLGSVLTVSLALGLAAGYLGGAVDAVVMRLADVCLAVPGTVLAVAIAGMAGPGLPGLVLGLVLTAWAFYARIIRGMVLQVRAEEYVAAAVAVGAGPWRIMLRHVLPAIAGRVAALASLDVGKTILAISGLSFLGLGAQPPAPEWGAMLNEGRPFFQAAPRLMLYPGAAILAVVLACHLVGDGLRQAVDPGGAGGLEE